MTRRRWVLSLLMINLLLAVAACSKEPAPLPTLPAATPTFTPFPSSTAPALLPTATASPTPSLRAEPTRPSSSPSPNPTTTQPTLGPALTEVQFALDVEPQTGELVFPAHEFVFGITRVYVRFDYQGLGDVTEAQSTWYLNENLVASGVMTWDGGDTGAYIIWAENSEGLERGEWRWEFAVDGVALGGGAFSVGGEPRYTKPAWGLALDPPMTWEVASEEENFVTFASPDQQQALALRVAPLANGLTETVAVALTTTITFDLAPFQQEHPDIEVVDTQDVTVSGQEALLQEARYVDTERGEQVLYIVSTLHAGAAYNVWMLGPADSADMLHELLLTTLRSIRLDEGRTTNDE
jgi:hypothetical protein